MTRTEMLREASVLLRRPETLGDGALLKSLALSDRGQARARAELARFAGDFPQLDLAALAAMPEGSFGLAVATFCRDHGITLLRPTDRLREASRDNPVAVRYAATHDLVHVLLGEGTDFAGEAAVYGFSCGQRYLWMHWAALAMACMLWCLLRPWQIARIVGGALRGYRVGRASPMLLAQRFEDRLAEPLEALRRELGLALE